MGFLDGLTADDMSVTRYPKLKQGVTLFAIKEAGRFTSRDNKACVAINGFVVESTNPEENKPGAMHGVFFMEDPRFPGMFKSNVAKFLMAATDASLEEIKKLSDELLPEVENSADVGAVPTPLADVVVEVQGTAAVAKGSGRDFVKLLFRAHKPLGLE